MHLSAPDVFAVSSFAHHAGFLVDIAANTRDCLVDVWSVDDPQLASHLKDEFSSTLHMHVSRSLCEGCTTQNGIDRIANMKASYGGIQWPTLHVNSSVNSEKVFLLLHLASCNRVLLSRQHMTVVVPFQECVNPHL